MKNARAAIRYAKAILNLARDSKEETAVNNDMQFISTTISENEEFEVMLQSPIVKSSDKINVLNAIFKDKVHTITLGLFHLLQDNKRIAMLASIAKQYAIIYDFEKNLQVAKVTTAVPLTTEIEAQILAKIVALTGDKANLENVVNPAILGGVYITSRRCAI
jgi:F-type H+-transporting ATPase subunit delta